jgi:predicted nucleic acid-binding Zn ribbon protein
MKKIGQILDSVLTKKQFYIRIKGNLALFKWDKIVGEKLAQFTTPLYYREGVLYIGVVSSIFMRELTFIKKDILNRIKQYVGESPVNDIKFRIIEKPEKKKKQYVPGDAEIDFSEINLT